MKSILISNSTFYDKDYIKTFSYQNEYKFFGISDNSSTLVPLYKELLQQVIGDQVNQTFDDRELDSGEIMAIKTIFENQIDETLPNRELTKPYHRKLEWKEKMYDLNQSIPSPNNRRIWDFYTIFQICTECLNENKPMFISIKNE